MRGERKIGYPSAFTLCVMVAYLTYYFHDIIKPYMVAYVEPAAPFLLLLIAAAVVGGVILLLLLTLHWHVQDKRKANEKVITRRGVLLWLSTILSLSALVVAISMFWCGFVMLIAYVPLAGASWSILGFLIYTERKKKEAIVKRA